MQPYYLPFGTNLDERFPKRAPLFGNSRLITEAYGEDGTPLLILDERESRRDLDRAPDHRDDPKWRDRLVVVMAFSNEAEREEHVDRVLVGVAAAGRGDENQEEENGGLGVPARPHPTPPGRTPGNIRTFAEAMMPPRNP